MTQVLFPRIVVAPSKLIKKFICLMLLAGILHACGGDANAPATAPSVKVMSGDITRLVAAGTAVEIDVVIKPNFTPEGTLYVTAVDQAGVLMSDVSVTANNDDSFTLALSTIATLPPSHHSGTVTLNLFSDSACTKLQPVPSIDVPFDINVLAPTSAWPGDNLSTLSAWPGAPDWAMFQGNAAHTGYVPVSVDPNRFSTRWQLSTISVSGTYYYATWAAPTTFEGHLFLAGNNLLYARKEFDGSLVWKYDFSGLEFPSINPPSVSDGIVYIAAGQQSSTFFWAFDAADGSLIFKSPMSSQWETYLAPTIGANGIYTNAGEYGGLYAFDRSGSQLFFAGMDQTSMWTPAVDAKGVYTYTGGIMKVVHPVSGAILHSISDPTFENYIYEIDGSPVLGAPGSVFVANYANSRLNDGAIGNTLINFDIDRNAIAWQVHGVYPATPAYADGILYVTNENPLRLEVRAEADGKVLWSWTPPQAGERKFKSEVLLTKNLVFVSTDLATYAIDVTRHRPVWSYPLPGRLSLSKNGILYIQGEKILVAFNLK